MLPEPAPARWRGPQRVPRPAGWRPERSCGADPRDHPRRGVSKDVQDAGCLRVAVWDVLYDRVVGRSFRWSREIETQLGPVRGVEVAPLQEFCAAHGRDHISADVPTEHRLEGKRIGRVGDLRSAWPIARGPGPECSCERRRPHRTRLHHKASAALSRLDARGRQGTERDSDPCDVPETVPLSCVNARTPLVGEAHP